MLFLACTVLLALMLAFNQVKSGGGLSAHEARFSASTPASSFLPSVTDMAALQTAHLLAYLQIPRPLGVSLTLFQVLLNVLLGGVLLGYWRRLGVTMRWGLLGLSAAAWAQAQAAGFEALSLEQSARLLLLCGYAWACAAGRASWISIPVYIVLSGGTEGIVWVAVMTATWLLPPPTKRLRRRLALPALLAFSLVMGWRHGQTGNIGALPDLLAGVTPLLAWATYRAWPAHAQRMLWPCLPWAAAIVLGWLAAPLQPVADLCAVPTVAPLLLGVLPGLLRALSHRHLSARLLRARGPLFSIGLLLACALLLGAFAVYRQISLMDAQGGLGWYERVQWERTCQVMRGEQGTPWQYRLFTDSLVYGTVRFFEAAGVPRPIGSAFVLVRLLQHVLTTLLAVAFFRRLGLSALAALFGMVLLTQGMGHGLYDTDMTFNTYTDLSLFLLAGILILEQRPLWLLPLMAVAALNRETSGCIPVMYLFSQWDFAKKAGVPRKTWLIFGAALLIWLGVVGGLRLVYGVRPYIVPTAGKSPILPLLWFNLTWWRTWVFLCATLGVLPLLAWAGRLAWPPMLRRFFWAVAPVWFPLHFCLAHAPETRLFLVPQLLIFVPGALLWATRGKSSILQSPSTSPNWCGESKLMPPITKQDQAENGDWLRPSLRGRCLYPLSKIRCYLCDALH